MLVIQFRLLSLHLLLSKGQRTEGKVENAQDRRQKAEGKRQMVDGKLQTEKRVNKLNSGNASRQEHSSTNCTLTAWQL